ncbi:MAG: M20/M25/M40 family metallo-hydrolase [Eubacteriales bacterium]|nr:M20/M25/M40 family metallo-hydrolase [Eubacteriales bacterium]
MIDEKRLVELFLRLARLNAPSLDERQVADAVTAELKALGLIVAEDDAASRLGGTTGNLLCRVPANWAIEPVPDDDKPAGWVEKARQDPLLFSTHLDTVQPCLGKKVHLGSDRIFRSDGTTILGADDLAGVAAVLALLHELRTWKKPHRPLELLFSVAEEVHLQGISVFDASSLHAREGYVLDTSGSPGTGIIAAPGHLHLSFTVQGRPAHAGIAPEAGISAIAVAAQGIARMRLGRVDPETTANIGRIEGGGETNIVAAGCTVTAECRSLDPGRLAAQARHMIDSMEEAAAEAGATVSVQTHQSYHPYRVDPDQPVARRFQAACTAIGKTARLVSTGGGSDLNVLSRAGLSGMVLSCGMQQVHSGAEYLALDDLSDLVRLLMALVDAPV